MIYAVVDRMTSRASSVVRYAVALGALALMPIAAVATFAVEMQTVAPKQATTINAGEAEWPMVRENADTVAPILEDRGAWLMTRAEQTLPWVDDLWMLGILLLAVRAGGGWWQLEQVRRRAIKLVPAELEISFRRMCARVRVGGSVVLRVSEDVISPLAMGVWRATVILPVSAVLRLSMEELESVLAHELGHIRRWDYAYNLMQTAVESALFFHPAVWWLSRIVRERREICCDEIAVESCADAFVYARALLQLEEQKRVQLRAAVALEGCGGSLLGRVKQVLGEGMAIESRMTSGVRIAAAAAVVMALLLGAKVDQAIAVPMAAVTQPAVTRITAPLEETTPPQAALAREKRVCTQAQVVAPAALAKPHAAVVREAKPAAASLDPMPDPRPEPVISVAVNAAISPAIAASIASINTNMHMPRLFIEGFQAADGSPSPKGMAYLDAMRQAGYPLDLNNDLDTLVALKSLGVTPEYAKAMAGMGMGKPSVHDLIALKSLGVTREYAAAMKQKGFATQDLHELVALKAQGLTPEYAGWMKQQFPQATTDEVRRAAMFHLDEKFMAAAKAHGFDGKSLDKLLRLRMSGLLDE
jgi:beta-lactamase regulating signal transducer with metallopeptidase domain